MRIFRSAHLRMFPLAVLLFVSFVFLASPSFGNVREFTLDNGLKVLIKEDHKVPLATFQIWYRIGSKDEPSGKTGLSHLLEHMMFKGTPKYGSKQFSKIIHRNGGVDNAMTSRDYTMYFQILSSDRIGLSVDLESDRMTNLIVDPKETLAERSVVMEERRMRYEDDPQSSLFEKHIATAFTAHPYRRPVIGWMSDLSAIERDDLYNHYRRFYAPDNAYIVIVGDVKTDEIMEKIRASFGSAPRGNAQRPVVTREPEQQGEKRITLRKEAELPYVLVGYHTPNFPHEDSFALEVLSSVLSAGKSSRLYQSLVYGRKIALGAGTDYSGMYRDPFLFFTYASVAPGKEVEEVEKALSEEIEKIKKTPPADTEVQKTKNQIEAAFIFGQDSLYMQAMKIGMFEFLGSWKLMDVYLEGIRKVTPEDVQRVAQKYLSADNRTVGILVPLKEQEKKSE